VKIRTYRQGEYDEPLAAEVTAVLAAAWPVDSPHETVPPPRTNLLRLMHGWDSPGPVRVLNAYDDDGRVVGHAAVEVSYWEDNQDLAWFELTVMPQQRGRGYGSALLEAATEYAVEAGKTLLMGVARKDSPADAFCRRHGYQAGQHNVQRRLDLPTLDWDRIDKLHREAEQKAAGYELIRIAGEPPEELLPDLVEVTAAINDAPLDDLHLEKDVFSTERVRAFGAAQAARETRVYRLLARRVADRSWAGQTIVGVDANRPTLGDQLDTSVVAAHRGHSLGMLLKSEMLRWLRDTEPQLTLIDTWNAASNSHMIAVNDLLGCRVVGNSTVWQRQL
jgi:GNAT superfamily N-acetyltransferase